ncbi:MarR family transcriptional regulator [Massilia sp. YIM B02769]|uniref:MarR family winged helix-turn-helix transcriptional regulator n=1 Tax=Massilia sp. YIM B02769 TaxID=3050129 RepID=UPI0025B6BBC4|nr:MarR family transcriptional regulator [Massilia sp. YIM B02769]MDN4059511.1 MarR family transcriptional regulator [Massilia sp. YIM B02769]
MSHLPNPVLTPAERFSMALHATAREWRIAIDKRLKDLGVGQSGWMTIAMIAKAREPLSQRALADLLGIEGPSVVSMLDRLERDGLVRREPSPLDRRVKLAHLTDDGRALYAKVREEADAFRSAMLDGLDPATLNAAADLLEGLRARIGEGP